MSSYRHYFSSCSVSISPDLPEVGEIKLLGNYLIRTYDCQDWVIFGDMTLMTKVISARIQSHLDKEGRTGKYVLRAYMQEGVAAINVCLISGIAICEIVLRNVVGFNAIESDEIRALEQKGGQA